MITGMPRATKEARARSKVPTRSCSTLLSLQGGTRYDSNVLQQDLVGTFERARASFVARGPVR